MKIIIRESLNCVKIGHGFELSSYSIRKRGIYERKKER